MSLVDSDGASKKLFSGKALFFNSAVAAIGAGAAMMAATGVLWQGAVVAVAGGIVGYSVTNDIPKN